MTTATKETTRLEEIVARYTAIRAEAGDKEPSPEQQVELEQLETEGLAIKAKIEQAEKDQQNKNFSDLSDWLNKPVNRPGVSLNADDDGRKMLARLGWECKNGILSAPTSLGKHVEMYGEDVLFGDLPDDIEAAKFFKLTRASFQPGYRQAYERYIRNCTKYRTESMAFTQLSTTDQKALAEGMDTGGGFIVPPDVQAEMLVRTAQYSVMRRLARPVTTSRDKIVFPRIQAASATASGLASGGASVFSSGFIGGWVGETPAFSETDPAFGTFEVPVKKIRVATKLSNDLLSDAATNVLAFLTQNGAENMALVEDQGFISGDGTPLQPLGILNGGAATVDVEGSTSNTISNTTAAIGSASKIITLAYTLPSQYAARGEWLMKRTTEGKVRSLVDGAGRFLWPDLAGSGFAPAPRALMGYPINNSEFMPADGTDTYKVFIFGDFSAYIIAQRAQITTVVLRERFADTDQTGIILFERVGGALWNTDAIRYGVV